MTKKLRTKLWAALCPALLLIASSLILSSCSAIPGYSEPEDMAIVSAIGFDAEDGRLTVTLQLAESGGEDFREIVGEGESIEAAIGRIASGEERSLEVAHLAAVVLGKGIDRTYFDLILDFCDRADPISSSARLISTNDAYALLSIDGVSGYSLSEMIRSSREDSSYGARSSLYRVKNLLLSDHPVFALPHFLVGSDSFELYGLKIYRSGDPLSVLDREEGAYYMMMCGLYDGGVLGGDASGLSASVGVAKCVTEYKSDTDKDTLTVRLLITLDSEIADDGHADEILSATARNVVDLYERLSTLHGDVFGFDRAAGGLLTSDDGQGIGYDVKFECERRR